MYGIMAYSTTIYLKIYHSLLVMELLKLVNICRSYKQMFDCRMLPIHFALSCSKMPNSPEYLWIMDRKC